MAVRNQTPLLDWLGLAWGLLGIFTVLLASKLKIDSYQNRIGVDGSRAKTSTLPPQSIPPFWAILTH